MDSLKPNSTTLSGRR